MRSRYANSGVRGDPKYNVHGEGRVSRLTSPLVHSTFKRDMKFYCSGKKENRSRNDFEAYFILKPLKISLDLQIAGSGFSIR